MNVTHKPGWSHTLLYDTVYDNLNKMFLTGGRPSAAKILVGSGLGLGYRLGYRLGLWLRLGLGLEYHNPNPNPDPNIISAAEGRPRRKFFRGEPWQKGDFGNSHGGTIPPRTPPGSEQVRGGRRRSPPNSISPRNKKFRRGIRRGLGGLPRNKFVPPRIRSDPRRIGGTSAGGMH